MNAKSVITLAVGVAIVATLAWWLNQQDAGDTVSGDVAVYPQLSSDPNAVNKIQISDASGQQVTVTAEDDTWRIAEKNGYVADAGKVRALVLALGNARVIEEKTSNPDYYERLGVRDIADKDSAATLLEITHGSDRLALLIGNSSPRAGGASLVRRAGEATALLVTPTIEVDTELSSWLDTRVLDFQAQEIQSVVVQGGKDRQVEITKAAMFDKDFSLAGLDESQSADSLKVNALGRSLAGLEFEDVIRAVAFAIGDYSFLDITYTLFDGIIIDAKVFYPKDADKENKKYWFAAAARFDEKIAQDFVPQPSASDDDGADSAAGDGDSEANIGPERVRLTAADIEDRRKQVDAINARLTGWMYQIAESRYNNVNVSAADLIKE